MRKYLIETEKGEIIAGYSKKGLCSLTLPRFCTQGRGLPLNNKKISRKFLTNIADENFVELGQLKKEINNYFAGKNVQFNFTLDLNRLTDFQKEVLTRVQDIPYGETVSYKFLAKKIGNSRAFRAVGKALKRNPLPIIIPCHRVIGSNGSLTGFSAGIRWKRYLINLEKKFLEKK